jgi:hypothetical protein
MNIGTMAMVFGVVFLLAGIAGFFPSPVPPGAPPLIVEHGHGLAMGMFPINTIHNVVHLLFGILGIAAARSMIMSARGYFQLVAVAYGLLVVLGLLPMTQTTFGLIPIWGADVWLHGLIAAGAAYFGFVYRGAAMRRPA